MLNDVKDVEADQHHPHKRLRAIAAGHLSPGAAVVGGLTLLLGGLAVTQADGTNWDLLLVVGLYVANSVGYVLILKTLPIFEMASVAAGFFLRAVAGASASHLFVSTWFLVVISFGALFLVVGKRLAELHRLGESAVRHRAVLSEYSDSFLTSALVLTSTVVVATYCLWAFDTSRSGLSNIRHEVTAIRLSVVPVVLVILYVLRELSMGGGGAPEDLVLEDRTVQVLGVIWAALVAIGVYG
jgi:decaprenyl-phosphate phosphoribosyltransferase